MIEGVVLVMENLIQTDAILEKSGGCKGLLAVDKQEPGKDVLTGRSFELHKAFQDWVDRENWHS